MARVKGRRRLLGVKTNPDKPFSIAYLECHSPEAAVALKEWFDTQYALRIYRDLGMLTLLLTSEFQNRKANASLTTSSLGNPFRTLPKGT